MQRFLLLLLFVAMLVNTTSVRACSKGSRLSSCMRRHLLSSLRILFERRRRRDCRR